MMFKLPTLLLIFNVVLVDEYCTFYQRLVLVLLSLFGHHFDQCPTPYRSHDSANHRIAKFIRENKSPEKKSVEFLIFGVLEKSHYFCAKTVI